MSISYDDDDDGKISAVVWYHIKLNIQVIIMANPHCVWVGNIEKKESCEKVHMWSYEGSQNHMRRKRIGMAGM